MIGWDLFTILCAIFLGSSGFILFYVFLRDAYRDRVEKIKRQTTTRNM
jgi:hypothetical protein